MRIWDCTSAAAEVDRPHVMMSTPEARVILLRLDGHEEMADHQVKERALLHVLEGSVEITAGDDRTGCGPGTLIAFEPGERHGIRAVETSTLLLTLAPWPAPDRFPDDASVDPFASPRNATHPER